MTDKILGSQNSASKKQFWSEKNLGPKKYESEKSFESEKKLMDQKKVLSLKKICSLKKILGQNFFESSCCSYSYSPCDMGLVYHLPPILSQKPMCSLCVKFQPSSTPPSERFW